MKTFSEFQTELQEGKKVTRDDLKRLNDEGVQRLRKKSAAIALKKAQGKMGGWTHTKDGEIKPVEKGPNPHVSSKEYMKLHNLLKKAIAAYDKHGPDSLIHRQLSWDIYKLDNEIRSKETGGTLFEPREPRPTS